MMDNSGLQSQRSMSSISTSTQNIDPTRAASTSNPPEFVNHGPNSRKRRALHSGELSVGANSSKGGRSNSVLLNVPAMFIPGLAPSRSIRQAIYKVKMVQVHLVEWLKFMVGNKRAEKEVDPDLDVKPTT